MRIPDEDRDVLPAQPSADVLKFDTDNGAVRTPEVEHQLDNGAVATPEVEQLETEFLESSPVPQCMPVALDGPIDGPVFVSRMSFEKVLAIWKTTAKIPSKYITGLLNLMKQASANVTDEAISSLPSTCETLLKKTANAEKLRTKIEIRQICRKPVVNPKKAYESNLAMEQAEILGHMVYLGILNGALENGPGEMGSGDQPLFYFLKYMYA